jgi:hypothetical protein
MNSGYLLKENMDRGRAPGNSRKFIEKCQIGLWCTGSGETESTWDWDLT